MENLNNLEKRILNLPVDKDGFCKILHGDLVKIVQLINTVDGRISEFRQSLTDELLQDVNFVLDELEP